MTQTEILEIVLLPHAMSAVKKADQNGVKFISSCHFVHNRIGEEIGIIMRSFTMPGCSFTVEDRRV